MAPIAGLVSQRSAEVGSRISAGQQLIVLVQTTDLWVTANFKETQLKKIRLGQSVTLKVDVQCLGVRIRFKANQDGLKDLRPGMSVEPVVHFE